MSYFDYATEIDQSVFFNGQDLIAALKATEDILARDDVTQEELDIALNNLKDVIRTLKRHERFPEPNALPFVDGLPDPFTFADGVTKVMTKADWEKRAEQLKEIYAFYLYGSMPDTSGEEVSFEKTDNGLNMTVKNNGKEVSFPVVVNLPGADRTVEGPYPVIVSFFGLGAPDQVAEANRRGYATITIPTQFVALDSYERTGAFFELYPYSQANNDVGSFIAWAWGAGKVLDVLEQGAYDVIDPEQSIITGFSRFGKAALVTAAIDERFAIANPQNSGAGGAASFRYSFAGKRYPWGVADETEPLGSLQSSNLGHWFNSVFLEFRDQYYIPVDQHLLMSLVAPRGLLITAGESDYWTNPEGMFVSYVAANEVYKFLGAEDHIGVAFRPGGHSINDEDIDRLLDFADMIFRGVEPESDFKTTKYTADPEWTDFVIPPPLYDSEGSADGSADDSEGGAGSGAGK